MRRTFFRLAAIVRAIGMHLGREGEELLFEGVRIEPGAMCFLEQGKAIGHSSSRAETLAARATGGSIWILDLESSVEGIEVVQLASGDIKGAFGIDNNSDPGGFDQDVAIGGTILEIHFILQAGTAAADNGDAEHSSGTALFGEQGSDLAGRARG